MSRHQQQGRNKSTKAGKQVNQLRIIGGQWRGRKLSFPTLDGLRPTGDRIRETLFNWLASDIPGSVCADLFAGSGALGFEALSRGAREVLLLEKSGSGAQQLRDNLSLLEASKGTVVQTDSLLWLKQQPVRPLDVVFIDPPFDANLWQETFDLLVERQWLKEGAAIYVETPRRHSLQIPAIWQQHREKRSGDVCYALYYYQP